MRVGAFPHMGNALENHRFENVDHLDADERGRVTLGSQFAGEKVFVAWSVVDYPANGERPNSRESQKYTELAQWAIDNGHNIVDLDPDEGRVLTKDAEWIDTPIDGITPPEERDGE